MISFLLRTDLLGTIEEVLWSYPVSLASKSDGSVFTLFCEKDQEKMKELYYRASLAKQVLHNSGSLLLNASEFSVQCCVVLCEEGALVFASDYYQLMVDESLNVYKELFDVLLGHFLKYLLTIPHKEGRDEVADHFAEIQKLNNELVNTYRKLQKANAQLNALNEDLNNRLVKDPLTGLVSRYQYRSEMDQIIATDPNALGLFFFLDIDDFKQVNDTYGHAAGDVYLIEFSQRLQHIPLLHDALFMRIAGDEFGIYVHNVQGSLYSFISTFWEQFCATVLDSPIEVDTVTMPVSCSVGISQYFVDTKNLYLLIEYADFAMYRAKKEGKGGYQLFDMHLYNLKRTEKTS